MINDEDIKEKTIKRIKSRLIINPTPYMEDKSTDVDILIAFVIYQENIKVLIHLNEKNLLSPEKARKIVEENVFLFPKVSKKLLNEKTFSIVLEKNAQYFEYFPEKYKNDKNWCLKAIEGNVKNIEFVNKNHKLDMDLLTLVLRKNVFYMNKIPDDMFINKELRDEVLNQITLESLEENHPKKFELFQRYERQEKLISKISSVDVTQVKRKKI